MKPFCYTLWSCSGRPSDSYNAASLLHGECSLPVGPPPMKQISRLVRLLQASVPVTRSGKLSCAFLHRHVQTFQKDLEKRLCHPKWMAGEHMPGIAEEFCLPSDGRLGAAWDHTLRLSRITNVLVKRILRDNSFL